MHVVKSARFTLLDSMGGLVTLAECDGEVWEFLNCGCVFSFDTAQYGRLASGLST